MLLMIVWHTKISCRPHPRIRSTSLLSIQSCHINDMDKQCTWSKFRITCSSSSVVDIVLVLMVPLERFLTWNKWDTCFGILDVQFGCTLWMYKLDVQFDGTIWRYSTCLMVQCWWYIWCTCDVQCKACTSRMYRPFSVTLYNVTRV